MSGPALLRLRAAALKLGVSARTLQRQIARGDGPRVVVVPGLRGRWVRASDLEAWLATLQPAAGAAAAPEVKP